MLFCLLFPCLSFFPTFLSLCLQWLPHPLLFHYLPPVLASSPLFHLQYGGWCVELRRLWRSAPVLHWQAEQTHCAGSTGQQARHSQPLLWLFPSCKIPAFLPFVVDSAKPPVIVAWKASMCSSEPILDLNLFPRLVILLIFYTCPLQFCFSSSSLRVLTLWGHF